MNELAPALGGKGCKNDLACRCRVDRPHRASLGRDGHQVASLDLAENQHLVGGEDFECRGFSGLCGKGFELRLDHRAQVVIEQRLELRVGGIEPFLQHRIDLALLVVRRKIRRRYRACQIGEPAQEVEEKGEAYYLNPISFSIHYLGRPNDAFSIMDTLQFQDITSQQMNHAASLLEDIEVKLNKIVQVLEGDLDEVTNRLIAEERKKIYEAKGLA